MQSDNRILDDMAKVATGALGSLTGLKQEIEGKVQQHLERLLGRMNLVSREEFDAMKAVAQEARAEQIRLARRVEALEARLGETAAPPAQHMQETPDKPNL
jgi:BMFP domain-containing protein YqiC